MTGTATQGQTLTASNTLADLDGLGTITYQWQANGTNISGATGSTYTLTQAEVGKTVTVVASYTDQLGTAESKSSSSTTSVANVNDLPTGSVTITGTATQGQTLTASNTLADLDGLGTITYQWQANGTNIGGATESTYTLSQAKVGKIIGVVASYTDLLGTEESIISTSTNVVLPISVIQGVVYQWNNHVQIDGASISLLEQSNSLLLKLAITDHSGGYKLTDLLPNTNGIVATQTLTTADTKAITPLDALAALKISVGLNPNVAAASGNIPLVSPYQYMAADVTGDGKVTPLDALAILKMSVGLSGSVTPSWVFVNESQGFNYDATKKTFSVTAQNDTVNTSITMQTPPNQTLNLVGILMGDVNGSWGASSAATTHIDYSTTTGTLNPTYWSTLATNLHTVPDQWGVVI
jgi:hypothetical protein